MKKQIIMLLAAGLVLSLITGCSNTKTTTSDNAAKQSEANNSKVKNTQTNDAGAPKVYMTTDISPKGLMDVYKALDRPAAGKVAVKLSVGEPGDTYYLSPDLIKDLVLSVNGTFVDCNTAYGGQRANTAMHKQAAEDHGFMRPLTFWMLTAARSTCQ